MQKTVLPAKQDSTGKRIVAGMLECACGLHSEGARRDDRFAFGRIEGTPDSTKRNYRMEYGSRKRPQNGPDAGGVGNALNPRHW